MLEIRPCDFATAQAFVRENHRHNKPPVGHKFSIDGHDSQKDVGEIMKFADAIMID